jgi:hypothetical protein
MVNAGAIAVNRVGLLSTAGSAPAMCFTGAVSVRGRVLESRPCATSPKGSAPDDARPRVGLSPFRLALIAMRLPWRDLARAAPVVVRAADRLLRADLRQREEEGPGSLTERVDRLDAVSVSQGDALRDMTAQTADVVRTQRVLGIQLLVAISLAAAALGVAIVALVRTL